MSNCRIYVACLASYNAGTLHGVWLELSDFADADDLRDAIASMLATSPEPGAEEWAIHDHEGFLGIGISEYEDLNRLMAIAQRLNDSDADEEAIRAAIHAFDEDEWEKALDENYRGVFEDEGDYAQELQHELHSPEEMGPFAIYIDWARMERDMELGGDITVVTMNGRRHIFTA